MDKNISYSCTLGSHAKKSIVTALLLAGIAHIDISQAAIVNTGDRLTITTGVAGPSGYVTSGSYFVWDISSAEGFQTYDRTPISQGSLGLIIGVIQPSGVSPGGWPIGTEGTIDAGWSWLGAIGMHFTVSPVTGDTTAGLDFSGWRMTWAGAPSIPLGGGMQNCGTTSDGICQNQSTRDIGGTYNNGTGIATFAWSGVYGTGYTLDYTAVAPQASAFGGIPYQLHLEGTVNPVPIPAAVWLFASGLAGLVGLARRRKI